jgi:hypothetical protein
MAANITTVTIMIIVRFWEMYSGMELTFLCGERVVRTTAKELNQRSQGHSKRGRKAAAAPA